ncbi:MAG: FkbM family methyltransferase [Thermodesulfobacteriota bacterium]
MMVSSKNVERLSKLITASDINENNFFEFIENVKMQKKVIIYGAGNRGLWILHLLRKYSIDVCAFLDVNVDNVGKINGIPVFRPECCEFTQKEKEEICILISTRYRFYEEIKIKLSELGYRNVDLIKCVWYTGDYNFETDLSSITNRRDDFLNCAKIIEDEKSFNIYEESILSYIRGRYVASTSPEYDNQYFPTDVPFEKGYSKFIDCGAYNGDTIEKLYEEKGKIDTLIAFEPDTRNYNVLIHKIRDNKGEYANNIYTYPCGVYSKLAQFKFVGKQGPCNWISEEGTSVIQCVSIDDVLAHHVPTFIKMDVEGAEYEALLGAKTIIQDYRPDLAICVYHSIADLSRIPLLIHSWDLGYKFYFRCHGDFNEELVMYATCE